MMQVRMNWARRLAAQRKAATTMLLPQIKTLQKSEITLLKAESSKVKEEGSKMKAATT